MDVLKEELISLKTDSYSVPEYEEVEDDYNDYYQEKEKTKHNEFELVWEGR